MKELTGNLTSNWGNIIRISMSHWLKKRKATRSLSEKLLYILHCRIEGLWFKVLKRGQGKGCCFKVLWRKKWTFKQNFPCTWKKHLHLYKRGKQWWVWSSQILSLYFFIPSIMLGSGVEPVYLFAIASSTSSKRTMWYERKPKFLSWLEYRRTSQEGI